MGLVEFDFCHTVQSAFGVNGAAAENSIAACSDFHAGERAKAVQPDVASQIVAAAAAHRGVSPSGQASAGSPMFTPQLPSAPTHTPVVHVQPATCEMHGAGGGGGGGSRSKGWMSV